MHPKLKSSLHTAIEKWIEKTCDSQEWEATGALTPPDLSELMASAAETVFDASVSASKHTEQELA